MTNPTQKPLEEGYFWVRVEEDMEWEPAEVWMKPDGDFDAATIMSAFAMHPGEFHEVGPRILPPQEGDSHD